MSNVAITTTNTTFTGVRLKLNEVIGVVNTLGIGNVANNYLTSTYVSNSTFQAFVANTNAYIAATSGTGEISNAAFQSFIANTNLAIADRLQVANADNKYTTKAYAAANSYVKLLLANTNAYIAEVQASIAAANEVVQDTIDYGFITTSADVDISRDYGTL
jgi:hypothetical protein